jgi:ATP-binding cassette, subfamily B, multidrug efflux pump
MIAIRKLLPFFKPYWRRSVVALLFLTGVVIMDLSIPRLIERIIDQGISQHNTAVVIQTSIIMLTLSALSTLFAIGNNNLSVQVGESIARDLREALFLKIQSFSFGNLDRFGTGKLIVRLTSDTSAVQRLFQIALRIGTRAPLLMIGSLILMVNTAPSLALTMLPLLVVTSVIIAWFSVKMEPQFRAVQQKLDRLNTVLQENIAGARLVKAFVRADFEAEHFEAANLEFTDRSIDVMQFMSSLTPVLTMCVNVGMVIVIWAGGLQSIRGQLTIGQIVAFTNYLLTTMTALTLMTMLSNILANGMASAQRVNEVLDTVPDIQDAPDAQSLPAATRGRVALEGVTFHYHAVDGAADTGLEQRILEAVTLVAEPGQTVAILGATGSGKSTLVNLIPRFYDPDSGQVGVDGMDVRALSQDSLLAHVGIVPQEAILFTGTVRDNIRYGRPEAGDDEVVAAARAAQAHDFILKLPQAYDTHIEERGVNLSGGQKQRISIARALLTQPKILILDDSTSAVDVETETKIQAALDESMHQRTTFVVAQRISTVLNADKIIVLDKGRVAAQGTHAELLRSSPIYREIYDSQLGAAGTPLDLSTDPAPDVPGRRGADGADGVYPIPNIASSVLSGSSAKSVDEISR